MALKFLRSSDPDDVPRFQREAHLLAIFEHPSIPRFYDYAPAAEPPYIAMTRAAGVPAAKFCQTSEARRLSPIEVAQVGWQLARVLEYIHQHGVLHRDLNANNVLIDLPRSSPMNSGRVRLERTPAVTLVDFGNAQLTEKFYGSNTHRFMTPPERRIAIPDGGIHTLGWAAPEARAGLGFSSKSDVYSLGVLLYRLLTGKVPTSKKQAEPVSPRVHAPTCPQDIAFAVLSALNADPDQRPSAAQLEGYLEDALTSDEILDAEATAEAETLNAESPNTPTTPTTLALVVPLRPPRGTAPADPKGWTQFFAATEHPPPSHAPRPDADPSPAANNPAANVLPLHPRDILQRTTTLEPDFAPPLVATTSPTRAPTRWAAAALLTIAALLLWSARDPDAPGIDATPTLTTQHAPPAPPTTIEPEPQPPSSPEQALAQSTATLAECARASGAYVEVRTSPGEPHFTDIDIDSDSTAATTCLRDALTRLRFQPPPTAKTLIKQYWP